MTKLMQTARLTQIARMDTIKCRVIVYTQPLDTAAFRIAAAKRWSPPTPVCLQFHPAALPRTALRPLPQEESGLLGGRRGIHLRLVHLGRLQR